MWTITYLVRPAATPTPVTEWRPSQQAALELAGQLGKLTAVLGISITTPEDHLFTAW